MTTGDGRHLPAIQDVTGVAHTRARNAMTQLHAALDTWAHDADRLADDGDLYALADGLDRIRDFRKAVRDLEQHIEDHVARLMPTRTVNLGDDVVLERHPGRNRRKWQSEELLKRLIGSRVVNADTGEDVTATLFECVPITASLAWRVGALRERGIQPDEWCEETPARTTVTVQTRTDRQREIGAGDD